MARRDGTAYSSTKPMSDRYQGAIGGDNKMHGVVGGVAFTEKGAGTYPGGGDGQRPKNKPKGDLSMNDLADQLHPLKKR